MGLDLVFSVEKLSDIWCPPEKFDKKQASVRAAGRQESVYLNWRWGLGRDRNNVLSFGLGNEACQVRRGRSETGSTFQKLNRNEKLGIAVHSCDLRTQEAETGGLPQV